MSEPARVPRITDDTLAQIRSISERQLSVEEVRSALEIPIGDQEREEVLSLVDWFVRRYPTPAERLAYVRRAFQRWIREQRAVG